MLSKLFYSIHRVLGTFLSILFLIWFLSGFVMIYHTFPKVKNMDRYARMEAIRGAAQPIDSLQSGDPGEKTLRLVLRSSGGRPFFEKTTLGQVVRIPADSIERPIETLSYPALEQIATRWSGSDIRKVDTLYTLDQWIPFGRLKKEFPIYKFYFGDPEKHQLYLSSQSGEALQYTDRESRLWAWLGAIPHWVYFTFLRQNAEQWTKVVVWLSGLGSVMCLTGLFIGVRTYIKQHRNRKKWTSPYRKFVYKWHHILGFVFGLFVFTFVFSGMMSLADLPQWIVKVHNPAIKEQLYTPATIELPNYTLDYRSVWAHYPGKVKSIEWSSFGQKPVYKVVVEDRLLTLDASSNEVRPLLLTKEDISARLSSLHSEPIRISQMQAYDNYYVGLTDHLPLPVYKAEVDDADRSTYYISPKNGNIHYYNNNDRAHRWVYQALHSFKFNYLAERPVLWNIVMWSTMIGGTLVSLSGVWLAGKYIKRKFRKRRSHHG